MPQPRTIKKYPNRRLYDTELSHYITLSDIRDLVMRGVEFQVIDTNSEEDLTRSILLQIMLEEESGGHPLFTATMLSQIIRFYGGTVQGIFARYLEESLALFSKQQEEFRTRVGSDSIKAMSDLAQRNLKVWSDMQYNFLKATGFGRSGNEKDE